MTILVEDLNELKEIVKKVKRNNQTIGFVPTMGALHAGHEALISKCASISDFKIVSVFVNPTQFGPQEDYSSYPRNIDSDLEICRKYNVDVLFFPSPYDIYGIKYNNEDLKIAVSSNNITYVCPPYFYVDKLCGRTRIGHFDGVATIVLKLFNLTKCDYACFGRKDLQQLKIIEKMVEDFHLEVKIVPVDIVREPDGLALSSRNSYLSKEGRKKALVLSKILFDLKNLYEEKNITDTSILFEHALSYIDKDQGIELEYLEFYDYTSFEKTDIVKGGTVIAIAVKIEGVRLIDNIIL